MDAKHLFYVAKVAEAAVGGKPESAVAYLRQFAEHLESGGQTKEAERLRRILEKRPARTASLAKQAGGGRIPVDSESALTIADRETIAPGSVHLILSKSNFATIKQFISYIRESDRLAASGVGISPTMLLYGPPGTGKTQAAHFVASEIGLPLVTARSDGLISSYLGSTAKNVRRLFEFAMSEPCVLFLDEFDAIAKKRDDNRELGELKRVVISLLQNIDSLDKDHILLAATNHEHLLDNAIWRRFTYRVKLEVPEASAREQLIQGFFGKYIPAGWEPVLGRLSEGLSGAQIKIAAENSIRNAIVHDAGSVEPSIAVQAILKETGSEASDRDDMLRKLRAIDERLFTESLLGRLVGLTQPAIHKILNKETTNGEHESSAD
jgi:hypothetical protein